MQQKGSNVGLAATGFPEKKRGGTKTEEGTKIFLERGKHGLSAREEEK